jgi:hypothetical protein
MAGSIQARSSGHREVDAQRNADEIEEGGISASSDRRMDFGLSPASSLRMKSRAHESGDKNRRIFTLSFAANSRLA